MKGIKKVKMAAGIAKRLDPDETMVEYLAEGGDKQGRFLRILVDRLGELRTQISLRGGGLRILKKRCNSYYLKYFGLTPDWETITTILQVEYW